MASRSGAERPLLRVWSVMVSALLLAVTLLAVESPPRAEALSGSEFNPGLIITDALFYDAAGMSEAEIQAFLTARGSALRNMTFSVSSRPISISDTTGNVRCQAFEGGQLSAAAIIFRAQAACGISAKVILVTLQKEQGLITKSAPSQGALDRAMGYACPDTAPCAPTTLGFGNQVYSGARQLNTYKVSHFGRQPGPQAIQWHPNAGCGSSVVNVQNYATAALYNYTPYQPNSAALANLGGTGDGCSSYGNRNFWVFYNTWFGSTFGLVPFPVLGPTVSGPSTVGATLTAQPGTWSGAPTFSYAWLICNSRPDVPFDSPPPDCVGTQGATATTYVSTAADVGKYIAVLITGSNSYGTATSGGVTPVPVGTPFNVVAPTVSGLTTVGATWTVDTGTWTGTPAPTIVIYWLRCNQPMTAGYTTVPDGCAAIAGANSTTYVSTPSDAGKYLTAQVAGNSPLGFGLAGATSTIPVGMPMNVTAPTVSGSMYVGSTWRVAVGTWAGTPAPTIATFWLRCNRPITTIYTAVPTGCTAIAGANSMTYTAVVGDIGMYLTAQLAGTGPQGFALAGAVNTTPIRTAAPINVVAPSVTGSPLVGSTWSVDVGTWTGLPAPTMAVFWLRCNQPVSSVYTTVPAGCAPISGANSTTYVSTSADAGKYLTAQVAGNSPLGFALAGAVNTTAIQAAVPANVVAPSVSGAAAVGSTWTVNPGTWTGTPAPSIVIFWLRCNQPVSSVYTTVPAGCAPISGANAATYVSTAADIGRYLTAQVAGNSPLGFALAGAVNTIAVKAN